MFETPMFGVHHQPEGRDWNHMKEAVLLVEDSGYDLFTVTDHFMNMANPEGQHNHPLEAWTLLAALAAETKKIRLSPLVSCYGYRKPTVLVWSVRSPKSLALPRSKERNYNNSLVFLISYFANECCMLELVLLDLIRFKKELYNT